jgi:hypothetical protein
MTVSAGARYSQRAMNGLQHTGAFLVQFRAGSDFYGGHVEGRVEHIASGRSASFASAAELLIVMAKLLRSETSEAAASRGETVEVAVKSVRQSEKAEGKS